MSEELKKPVKSAFGLAYDEYVDAFNITPEDAGDVLQHFHAGWHARTVEDVLVRCTWCGLIFTEGDMLEPARGKISAHILACSGNPMNAPQPCGHPARYVYPPTGDQGATRYCIACQWDSSERLLSAVQYADKVEAENKALKARVLELENSRLDAALDLLKQVAALEEPMPCGHPGRFALVDANGSKNGCAICLGSQQAEEMDRYWKAIGLLDPEISIDDAIDLWHSRETPFMNIEKKMGILRKALDEYANPDNWTAVKMAGETYPDCGWLPDSLGFETAEAALEEVDEMDKE